MRPGTQHPLSRSIGGRSQGRGPPAVPLHALPQPASRRHGERLHRRVVASCSRPSAALAHLLPPPCADPACLRAALRPVPLQLQGERARSSSVSPPPPPTDTHLLLPTSCAAAPPCAAPASAQQQPAARPRLPPQTPTHVYEARCTVCSGTGSARGRANRRRGRLGTCLSCLGLGYVSSRPPHTPTRNLPWGPGVSRGGRSAASPLAALAPCLPAPHLRPPLQSAPIIPPTPCESAREEPTSRRRPRRRRR
jgi:hypothetical protein